MAQEQQKNDMKRINEVASKARDVQARFSERIKNLENKEFNSIVADGRVKIKMLGSYKVSSVIISPKYLALYSAEQVGEALTMAFNNCCDAIAAERKELEKMFSEETQAIMVKTFMEKKKDDDGEEDDDDIDLPNGFGGFNPNDGNF